MGRGHGFSSAAEEAEEEDFEVDEGDKRGYDGR